MARSSRTVAAADRSAPLVAAVGGRETGKTTWIQQGLRRHKARRLLVWDPVYQFAEFGTVFRDRVRLLDFVGTRTEFAAVYQPGDDMTTYAKKFDFFCRLAWRLGGLTLVVDELTDVTTATWAPPAWSMISRKGRHPQGGPITTFGAVQRPARVDKDFFGNCTFIHCGRLVFPADVRTMAEVLGVEAAEIAALPNLSFIERNMVTGETRRSSIAYKPR